MAEQKELGIKVTGDITDVTNSLSDLVTKLEEIVDKTVSILVAVNDSELENLDNELQSLDNQTLNETVDVESTELDTVEADIEALDGGVIQETLEIDSTGIDEAKTGLDEIGTAAETASSNVTTSMDSAGKSVSDFGDKAQDAADKTKDIGDQAKQSGPKAESGFGQAFLALAGLTAGLEIAAEQVQGMNIAFDKMSNTAGSIPEDRMRNMIATITNAKFPSTEALTYITLLKQMGVTSEEVLGRSATDLNKMRIATGSSEEAMKKFANTMVVMGVDIANLPSIFNAVAYANANIIGGFETYVQWMQKFDSAFKEMGLNIDQTVVIIAAATKKWGGGRAAYSGLNEAIKESNGNLDILEQKLGLQPGALSKASEATAKYSGKIDRNAKSVQDHTRATQRGGEVVDDVNVLWGDWIETLGGAAAAIVGFGTVVGIVIPKVLQWFDQIWKLNWAARYVDLLKWIKGKIWDFGSWVGNTIKGWMGWGDDAGKAGWNIGQKLSGNVENPTFFSKLKDFGTRVTNTIKGWMGWGEQTKTIDMVKGMDSTWEMKAPGFLEKVTNFFRNLPQRIMGVITERLPSLSKIGELIPTTVAEGVTKAAPLLFKALSIIGDLGIASLLEEVRAGLVDIGASYKTGIPEVDYWNAHFMYMAEGLQYVKPLIGHTMILMDLLNGTINNLLTGKGWDSFGLAWEAVRDRVNRDANSIGEVFKQTFGVELPELLNPLFLEKVYWNFDLNAFMNMINGIDTEVSELFSGQLNLDFFGWLFGDLNAKWVSFSSWLSTIPAQITAFFSDLPTNLGRLVGDAIVLALQGIYYGLSFIFNLPTTIMTSLNSLYQQLTAWVNNIKTSLTAGFLNLQNSIWSSLTGIVEKVKAAVKNITDKFGEWSNYIKNLPKTITTYLNNLANDMVNAIKAIPNKISAEIEKIKQKFKDLEAWLKGLPNMIGKWIEKTFTDAVNYVKSIPDKIMAELNKIKQKFLDFINWIGALPKQLYTAISNAITGFLKGLSEKFPQIAYWLGKIRDLFPHSPPKEGPLKDIMSWGGNIADAIQTGFDKKFSSLAGHFTMKAGELKNIWDRIVGSGMLKGWDIPESQMTVINNAMNTLNQPGNINNQIAFSFKVDNVNANTSQEAKEALVNVEEAVKDILSRQLAQKGINLF
ncbi:MAG: hypothetical protein QHH15_00550 [Candidatus Thermoplasmatota archaeon]|nr:hypothetical protein [Candidatus Thermoplasmatota archaeon]